MDLTTKYLGMQLRTPLVASASPLSQEIGGIRSLEDAGASAVVLYSLFEEQLRQQYLLRSDKHGYLRFRRREDLY
jgi:dihydroorotate dehydrogenase (fumarate)